MRRSGPPPKSGADPQIARRFWGVEFRPFVGHFVDDTRRARSRVVFGIRSARAIWRRLRPSPASSRARPMSTARGGRPSRAPRARAFSSPSLVRSLISSRSNSANATSIVTTSRDIGSPPGRTSIACVTAIKRTPHVSSSRSWCSRSSALRPKRSSFQTSTASIRPVRAASSTLSRPGRSLRAPLPVSSMFSTTHAPRRRAASRRSFRAAAGF